VVQPYCGPAGPLFRIAVTFSFDYLLLLGGCKSSHDLHGLCGVVLLRPEVFGASGLRLAFDGPRMAWRPRTFSSGLWSPSLKLPRTLRRPHPSGASSSRALRGCQLSWEAALLPQRLVPALTPMRARFRIPLAANAPRPARHGGLPRPRSYRRALECAVPCRSFINSDRDRVLGAFCPPRLQVP
jgi:hypothetical protein